MKKSERRNILILIIVAIIIIVALVKWRNGKDAALNGSDVVAGDDTAVTEEFVEVLDDGSKVNTSSKLSETKTFENFEISNIQLTEQDGQSLILADVKNVGETKSDVTLIDITLLDKDGNEITTIGGIIGDCEAGESVQLNASATTDFANAYDLSIKLTDNSTVETTEAAPEESSEATPVDANTTKSE